MTIFPRMPTLLTTQKTSLTIEVFWAKLPHNLSLKIIINVWDTLSKSFIEKFGERNIQNIKNTPIKPKCKICIPLGVYNFKLDLPYHLRHGNWHTGVQHIHHHIMYRGTYYKIHLTHFIKFQNFILQNYLSYLDHHKIKLALSEEVNFLELVSSIIDKGIKSYWFLKF